MKSKKKGKAMKFLLTILGVVLGIVLLSMLGLTAL